MSCVLQRPQYILNALEDSLRSNAKLSSKVRRDSHGQILFDTIGAASIAQAIFVKTQDGPVVVKVQRPRVKVYAIEDHEIIDRALQEAMADTKNSRKKQLQSVRSFIDKLFHDSIEPEFDFKKEAGNFRQATEIYEPYGQIRVPKVLHVDRKTIWMEKAPGMSFHKNFEELKALKASGPRDKFLQRLEATTHALNHFYRAWSVESMFYGGFFHADPQPANIFYDYDAKAGQWTIYPIDFGGAGVLKHYQRPVWLIGAGVWAQQPMLILDGLNAVSTKPVKWTNAMRKEVEALVQQEDFIKRVQSLGDFIVKHDLDIPSEFVEFFRANTLIMDSVIKANTWAASEGIPKKWDINSHVIDMVKACTISRLTSPYKATLDMAAAFEVHKKILSTEVGRRLLSEE